MAKTIDTNDRITAEIGKVYLTMEKFNGKTLIEFSTNCVDPELNGLCDFAMDEYGVALEPDRMFGDCTGWVAEEIEPNVFDAIRKWIADHTDWKFTRDVNDSGLIEEVEG